MEKCDKCGEFIEFVRLCPLCAHYEKERLKRSAKKCEERAIEAEALARELAEALEKAIEEVKHPICGPGSAVEDLEATLAKTKEVLGDEQRD